MVFSLYVNEYFITWMQKEVVYGLTEVLREEIKSARLVANPGCYPTSIQLPLVPLIKANLIEYRNIIIDAKSGVSGARRGAKEANLYTEIVEGIYSYGITRHRHVPEIEQGLSDAANSKITVSFTPHLMPMIRGMQSTIYLEMAPGVTIEDFYQQLKISYELLAIKKLDTKVSGQQRDEDFFELVSSISKLCHANIVELVGYCAEHSQRLLVYEYCRNGTLHDALHDDEIQKNLSWKTRIQVALEAVRALEYLHEICQPPIVHRNFKSANLLLDDKLELCVSDCGLAPLLSSSSASQSLTITLVEGDEKNLKPLLLPP
ncbi:uncharacterized protein LOC142620745 [Castanea sativa]|uniref:uncharacterized protein LOC142620745 n=1 Tax=Castanea sativa TaxID=21020 RepID=UPI003F64D18A